MKVLKSFEISSQPDGPVGKPNQPVHWVMFAGTIVWVFFFVCVGSWSFEVGIALHLFFWISKYVRTVLDIFLYLLSTGCTVSKTKFSGSLGSFFRNSS